MTPILNRFCYRPGDNAEVVYARSKPTFVNAYALVAGVETVAEVPQGATLCIFSSDGDFFVRPDAPAIVPATDITDGSAPELNPAQWDVQDISSLHLIAVDDTTVTLSFYQ